MKRRKMEKKQEEEEEAKPSSSSSNDQQPPWLTYTKSEMEMKDEEEEADPMITASMKAAQEEAEAAVAAARAQEDEAHKGDGPVVPTLLRAAGVTTEEAPDKEDKEEKEASSSSVYANGAASRSGVRRTAQLDTLLQKASHFNNFILGKLEQGGTVAATALSAAEQKKAKAALLSAEKKKKGKKGGSKKKTAAEKEEDAATAKKEREEALGDAARRMAEGKKGEVAMEQPASLKNGTLKPYQLEGLNWLSSLWMNGLNGILADEMGLGKTIQVISLFALLREKGVNGPFLVVAPLATLPNWVLEVRKWLPSASVCLYHGTAKEREELREEQMPVGRERETSKLFPIVVTSYEMASIDRKFLMMYQWRWLVVDEGQRIKNRNGRLFNELKEIPSESRLLLSGTPIQNSLVR